MATTTSTMGLTKPDGADVADIGVINGNMDKLDVHRHGGGADGSPVRAVQGGPLSSRPSPGTGGQLYVATDVPALYVDDGTTWEPAGQSLLTGGLHKLDEVILTSSSTSITFSSISQSYRDLGLSIVGRTTANATDEYVLLQFNGDTGNNYDYNHAFINDGSAYKSNYSDSVNAAYTVLLTANSSPTGAPGSGECLIFDYARTAWNKVVRYHSYARRAAGNHAGVVGGASWRNTAAITSITLIGSRGGSFVAGTRATLYGYP